MVHLIQHFSEVKFYAIENVWEGTNEFLTAGRKRTELNQNFNANHYGVKSDKRDTGVKSPLIVADLDDYLENQRTVFIQAISCCTFRRLRKMSTQASMSTQNNIRAF